MMLDRPRPGWCVPFALFLFVAARTPAGDINRYTRKVWTTVDGLPDNTVNAIIQTRDRYFWLGTEAGLTRFDGQEFVTFDSQNTKEMSDSYVQSLFEDRDGGLWIGTGSGLLKLSGGVFVNCSSEGLVPKSQVFAIYEDRGGSIWIGTDGSGLFRLKDGRSVQFTTKDGLINDFIRVIREDKEGSLWIGTRSGLSRLKDGAFTNYTSRNGLPADFVRALHEDKDGGMWIGTYSGGLVLLKDGKFRIFSQKDGLAGDRIRSIYGDKQGNLWISTGQGLSFYSRGTFSTYTRRGGLSDNAVNQVFEDEEGNIWAGTNNGGLNRLMRAKIVSFTRESGLPSDTTWPVCEDRKGRMWIGTNAGLCVLKDGEFFTYTAKDGLSNELINTICEDGRGDIWIGTEGGGLNLFVNGRFKAFTSRQGLSNDAVRAVCGTADGNLWLGTYGGGLCRFRDGGFTVFSKKDGLSNNIVSGLFADRKGGLWIMTHSALDLFKDGRFISYTTRDGLSDNFVYAIYEDGQGVLWLGTYVGLTRYKDGVFKKIGAEQGVPGGSVFSILEDGRGSLWLGTRKGISAVKKQDLDDVIDGRKKSLSSMTLDESDGMENRECVAGAYPPAWKSRDGMLWFPTVKGLAVVAPDEITVNDQPVPVVIQSVTADGENIPLRPPVRLAPGRRRLEFRFAALSFTAPEKTRYRFRLGGFENNWVEAGARRIAFYTNLPPGRYVFRVTASNSDGIWNTDDTVFEFFLRPYFYQTIFFYILSGLAVILVGIAAFSLRVRRMKARERKLVALVKDRTKRLEEANRALGRLALLDHLTEIANRRQFNKVLENEWRRAARGKKPLSLIMIDIDHFKTYNDSFGHQAGDEALKAVASALKSCVHRPADVVARYGGEEFIVLLADTDAGGALAVAGRLRLAVEDLNIAPTRSETGGRLTISLGAATAVPKKMISSSRLVGAADEALYRAKQGGRNRVESVSIDL
jgi:diguanylate cyclase (GGDEF)-like protein